MINEMHIYLILLQSNKFSNSFLFAYSSSHNRIYETLIGFYDNFVFCLFFTPNSIFNDNFVQDTFFMNFQHIMCDVIYYFHPTVDKSKSNK